MDEAAVSSQAVMTEADLGRLGFTDGQIERLNDLRDRYLALERIVTHAQYDRLAFLRWCYRSGRLD